MAGKDPFKELFNHLQDDQPRGRIERSPLPGLPAQRLEALYRVSQYLNSILDPERLFEEIVNKIKELLNVERVVIVMKEDGDFRIRIAHNIDDQAESNALKFSRSVVKRVMKDYQPLFCTNALKDERFTQFRTIHQLEILSFICVPILVEQEAIGSIYVDNRKLADVFTRADVDFLQAFANLLGVAIRNSLAYQKIEMLNRSLEEKVQERTAELQNTLTQLQQTQDRLIQSEKMASLGRLIAGFMHEFNNPINFIFCNLPHLREYSQKMIAAIDRSLNEMDPQSRKRIEEEYELQFIKEDLLKLVEGMQEGAQRSLQIVEDLKKFSGMATRSREVIDWTENLRKVTEIFQNRIARPIDISVDSDETLRIEITPVDLNQAMFHLLQNAVDAKATQIRIQSRKEHQHLVCEIEDNGCGIEPKDLPHIFDPFFTTKKVGQGMGLGLSLVYSVIHQHRGSIEAESRPNQATVFRIRLPIYTAPENDK
ncbi:MAG: hypothetical protein Kow0042_26600 [Calditrichia bacterium]